MKTNIEFEVIEGHCDFTPKPELAGKFVVYKTSDVINHVVYCQKDSGVMWCLPFDLYEKFTTEKAENIQPGQIELPHLTEPSLSAVLDGIYKMVDAIKAVKTI